MGDKDNFYIASLEERLRHLEEERDQALSLLRQARASQCLFQAVVQGTSLSIFAKDLQSRYILFNPAAESVTGKKADQVLGHDDATLFPPADARRIIENDQQVIASGENITFEESLPDATGHLRTFRTIKGPVRDFEGKVIGLFGIARDITDLKRVEEALRQAEHRCNLVYQATNDVIWDLDLTENIIFWTGAVEPTFGYTEGEISPALDDWEEHLHPDDRDRVVSSLKSAIDGDGERWTDEYRLRRKDETYAVVFDRGLIVRDEDGKAVRMIGSIQDITDRKRLETERDRLMSELEVIIQFLPEGLVLFSSTGEILRFNPAADALLAYPPEVKGLSLPERYAFLPKVTISGEYMPLDQFPVTRALRGEIVQSEVIGYNRPDGHFLWLSISAAPIYSPDGHLQGVVATYADVSRIRQLQEQKDGYLHTITHDLRTPLTVIQGHAELLRPIVEKADTGEVTRISLDAILIACRQIEWMMKDLTEMARLEGGNLELKPDLIVIDHFVADYLRRSQVVMDVSRVIAEIPSELPPAWADPQTLERSLDNLVSNALKYSGEDSPIRIHAGRKGKQLVISVEDRGPGIPPEDIIHIFDRFYRVRCNRKQGLGLGLFIARSLVEANGGRLWAESESGRGSTFYLSVPIAQR